MIVAESEMSGGKGVQERRAERRERLIGAAVRVYGDRGYRNASVKAVCLEAGLTERYFYESFVNSEALLVASAEAVMRALMTELHAAAAIAEPSICRVAAMLRRFFELLKNDPKAARVYLVEIRGVSERVDDVLLTAQHALGRLVTDLWGTPCAATDTVLVAGVVGGVTQVALTWIAERYARPVEEVLAPALNLCGLLAPDPAGCVLATRKGGEPRRTKGAGDR